MAGPGTGAFGAGGAIGGDWNKSFPGEGGIAGAVGAAAGAGTGRAPPAVGGGAMAADEPGAEPGMTTTCLQLGQAAFLPACSDFALMARPQLQ